MGNYPIYPLAKKIILFFWVFLIFFGLSCTKQSEKHPTLSRPDLFCSDRAVKELEKRSPWDPLGPLHLKAYLYLGQKILADTLHLKGTLDPINAHIIQLFYPDYQPPFCRDVLSKKLAEPIASELDGRFIREQSRVHPQKLFVKKDSWQGERPYEGIEMGSLLPWSLTKPSELRAPPPSTTPSFWQMQWEEMHQIQGEITAEEKEKISQLDQIDWIEIADKYMLDKRTPLSQVFEVRAKLALTLLDAAIAVFDSKYTYLIQRPDSLHPQADAPLPTPNYPSYPSAHSTLSAAAAVILSHYFPENHIYWERLAEEVGLSRIWAGVNFPVDHIVGKALGHQVGQATLSRIPY